MNARRKDCYRGQAPSHIGIPLLSGVAHGTPFAVQLMRQTEFVKPQRRSGRWSGNAN